jgi:hypothetical protein
MMMSKIASRIGSTLAKTPWLVVFTFCLSQGAAAQQPNPSGGQADVPPGSGDAGAAQVVVLEGEMLTTPAGEQPHVTAAVLEPNAADPRQAADIQGEHFKWDAATHSWINTRSGERTHFMGFVCLAPGGEDLETAALASPQAPGGTADTSGEPVVVMEKESRPSATGAHTQASGALLRRTAEDPRHGTDADGRIFSWDAATNGWVNSQTGGKADFVGYLCPVPETFASPAGAATTPAAPAQPQGNAAPGKPAEGAAQVASSATPAAITSQSAAYTPVSRSGFAPSVEVRGFGGEGFSSGNSVGTAGVDGAVLFHAGDSVRLGPMAGWLRISRTTTSTTGNSSLPDSDYTTTSSQLSGQGNFGGRIGFPFSGWEVGAEGGAVMASLHVSQEQNTCTASVAQCTLTNSAITDTVVGPFFGGYFSRSLVNHVGVFAKFEYSHLQDKNNGLDSGDGVAAGGIVLNLGRSAAR